MLLGVLKSLDGDGAFNTRQSLSGMSKFACKQRDNCIAVGHQAVGAFGVGAKSALLTKFSALFVLLLFKVMKFSKLLYNSVIGSCKEILTNSMI